MTPARRREIWEAADIVRRGASVTTPVDVSHLVELLGGSIAVDPTLEAEAKIERLDEGFRILLNDEGGKRRQFTLAHELGHLFLHMGYLRDDRLWESSGAFVDSVYYRQGFGLQEYEANEFAAALLMPAEEFAAVAARYRNSQGFDLRAISAEFGVSTEAALTRGKWLGLFSW